MNDLKFSFKKNVLLLFVMMMLVCTAAFAEKVTRYTFNPQKNLLTKYFDFGDTKEYVFDFNTGKESILDYKDEIKQFNQNGKYKRVTMQYSDSGKYKVVIIYDTGSVLIYDTKTGEKCFSIEDYGFGYLFISPDDRFVILQREMGGGWIFFDLNTNEYLNNYYTSGTFNTYYYVMKTQNALALFSSENCEIINLDDDSTIAEFELGSNFNLDKNMAFSDNEKYLALGYEDTIKIIETKNWKIIKEFKTPNKNHGLCFTKDGKSILSDQEGDIHCYDISTLKEKYVLNHKSESDYDRNGDYRPVYIFVSKDGTIATCADEVKFWNPKNGELISSKLFRDPTDFLTLGNDAYKQKDYKKAVEFYRKSAEAESEDSKESSYLLGKLYYDGDGVRQNHTEARAWFEKSAAQGNLKSQYTLGNMYRYGISVEKNYEKARQYYEQAAAGAYGRGLEEAVISLGEMYELGLGVPQDYSKARSLYESRKYSEEAKKHLNSLYERGLGVTAEEYYALGFAAHKKEDYSTAKKWYEKADALGTDSLSADALDNIGRVYRQDQNYKKAYEYFEKAYKAGDGYNAAYDLGWSYESGQGVTQDYIKAYEYYEKAALQGNPYAQNALGCLYYNGQGITKDKQKAKYWFEKATAQGNENAKKNLKLSFD